MFVHCHKCGWEQDDFYDKSYNPSKFLSREYDETLFGSQTSKLNEIIHCCEFINGIPIRPDMTMQENIARWYEYFGRRIREMKWTTYDQYYKDPNKVCPKCGSNELCTD